MWWSHCWGWGRLQALCWFRFWVSRPVLWVVCVRLGWVLWPLAGRGVQVGGACLAFCVGSRFVGAGRLVVGGARR